MPELPDLTVYVDWFNAHLTGEALLAINISNPFLLKTHDPPVSVTRGKSVLEVRRMGKRIIFELNDKIFLVFHLMIMGRFQWRDKKMPAKSALPRSSWGRWKHQSLASFEFTAGTLILTEKTTQHRVSLHVVSGEKKLELFDRGGIEVLEAECDSFAKSLQRENHTLKRALTDPRFFAGIGNAYSDEILHRARLSPFKKTNQLTHTEVKRLFDATQDALFEWIERLKVKSGPAFPIRVTAFHEEMAVHGKFGQPCPVCKSPVQRIVYAENESNYCATCQTGGRVLADRALSRILKGDWPRSLAELEEIRRKR